MACCLRILLFSSVTLKVFKRHLHITLGLSHEFCNGLSCGDLMCPDRVYHFSLLFQNQVHFEYYCFNQLFIITLTDL